MQSLDLDSHNQPLNFKLNYKRNKEKSLNSLYGYLGGIVADGKINHLEFNNLHRWIHEQAELSFDYDIFDIKNKIHSMLDDKEIDDCELEELKNEIEDILEYRELDSSSYEALINLLIGKISGIIADGKINVVEILYLKNWILNNNEIVDKFPANIILDKISEILEDGKVTDEEKIELINVLKDIVGDKSESEIYHRMSTAFFCDSLKNIVPDKSVVCFTGKFISGQRSKMEEAAKLIGLDVKFSITSEVNLVVIGSLASRDWKFNNFGRKIEKALQLRASGHEILITNEIEWNENCINIFHHKISKS